MIDDGLLNHGWNVEDVSKVSRVSKSAIRCMKCPKTCNHRIDTLVKGLDALDSELAIQPKGKELVKK